MTALLVVVIVILLVGAGAFKSALVAAAGTVGAVLVLGGFAAYTGMDPVTALISLCVVALLGRVAYVIGNSLRSK